MFGINGAAAQGFCDRAPNTFKAMQHLVMAMDDVAKHAGKKTWFGRDKTERVTTALTQNIGRTISAMRSDGIVAEAESAEDVRRQLQEQVTKFFEAFPTWVNAQIFATIFFSQDSSLEIVKDHVRAVSRGNSPGTLYDKAKAASREIIIAGYREIARQAECAPSSKTSDDEIVEIYQIVATAFHEVAEIRGERLSAGIKNAIVLKFLQLKESDVSVDFFAEHLKYELNRYRTSGLRDDYKREINLFKVLGLE
jgi:hypothetical protein